MKVILSLFSTLKEIFASQKGKVVSVRDKVAQRELREITRLGQNLIVMQLGK